MSAALIAPPAKLRRPRTIVPAPVPLVRGSAGSIEGLELLDDLERALGMPEDDALAVALWLAVRRVFAWADTPVEKRRRLRARGMVFRDCAAEAREEVPSLAAALKVLPALWTRPERVEPGQVADACDQVGRWAADAGLMRTAGMFMEAAAAAEPENALRAMDAGLMCQRLGGTEMMRRAEQWHQRAFGLARVAVEGRRLLSIRALLAYGNWARDAGDYRLARKCYEKAARRARRTEAWPYYAAAHHNLLIIVALTSGDLAAAEAHVCEAIRHYPADHPRLPILAHDFAALLSRHRLYSSALRLLENAVPKIERPDFRALVYGNLALAAAGAGRRDAFDQAVSATLPLCAVHADTAPGAFAQIAEGALILGMRNRARLLAEKASRLAAERGDAGADEAARRVLELCERGTWSAASEGAAPQETIQLVSRFADVLAREQSDPAPDLDVQAPQEVEKHGEGRSRSRPVSPAPQWPLWGGVETIAGLTVLQEVEPTATSERDSSLSVVLWLALRGAYTWAGAAPGERAALFSSVNSSLREHILFFRSRIPGLHDAFGALAALYQSPELIGRTQVGDAYTQVAEWAAGRGLLRTALLFMEAAAAVEPDNALRAMDAGLMCQRASGAEMMMRAQEWHQRAFGLARRAVQGRRLLSIRALLAYGNWARDAGDYPLAQECYGRAARRAWRWERWPYYAAAHHNLLIIVALTNGDLTTAEAHVQAAIQHYPSDHPRLPILAYDFAALLNRHRLYSSALRLLENAVPKIERPDFRALVYGNLALAAAGAGRRDAFERAVSAALPLCAVHPDSAPGAFVQIAEGALLCRDYTQAAEYAGKAWELGTARGDTDTVATATRLRRRIAAREPAPREAEIPALSKIAQLQRAFRSRLHHRRPQRQKAL